MPRREIDRPSFTRPIGRCVALGLGITVCFLTLQINGEASGPPEEIVFAVRQPGRGGHWYENFGYSAFDENVTLSGAMGLIALHARRSSTRLRSRRRNQTPGCWATATRLRQRAD